MTGSERTRRQRETAERRKRAVLLSAADFADAVVPRPPPQEESGMVAAALTCDPEHISVVRLAELLVEPDDDGVVAFEVAELTATGTAGAVLPCVFATPAKPLQVPSPRTMS